MAFAKLGAEIMRDYTTDGVAASGPWQPIKGDMRAWMATVESGAGSSTSEITNYGYGAGASNTTDITDTPHSGDLNTNIGVGAGQNTTTGFAMTCVGSGAGTSNTTGDSNTWIGTQAGGLGVTAKWNVGVGVDALLNNVAGRDNTAIGHHVAVSANFPANTGENVFIGSECLHVGVGGVGNVAIGYRAYYNGNAAAVNNVFVGHLSGFAVTAAQDNTEVGFQTGQALTTGSGNVSIGSRAGYSNITAANNVAVGFNAGFTNTSGQRNVFLGPNAGFYETSSDVLIIDNRTRASLSDAHQNAMLYGVFNASMTAQLLWMNGGFIVGNGSGGPTGGNKGAGSINAGDVYNDNVALTCFGVEYLIDGKVDIAKWDGFLPAGRQNGLVRRFVEMTEQFDPRDPRAYLDYLRSARSLPGMPTQDDWQHNAMSQGELTQRLWLATELLACAFAGQVAQVEALTAEVAALRARMA